ncbi:hypothetical protein Tsubulata_022367 [Turnera subulata]|uniref:Uncharacterized protein n=1 Tax=Turnera subulata TaxID=218843 RepID=A0A9Q0J0Q5_9ROSI|nr:hypothetical protein Tsubulata_022367 [Turnera subulata]
MAMPPGNVVMADKMQFPPPAGAGGGGGGVEISQHHHQHHHRPPPPQQWFPVDERDGFISWLRGEFAAANAIIDSLCHHLRLVGEPGEYDLVIGYVQQRRCNWNHVLHMQQYFSVAEVVLALQQVASRRQQQQQQQSHQGAGGGHQRFFYDHPKLGGPKRSSNLGGFNKTTPRAGSEAVKDSSVDTLKPSANVGGNVLFEDVKSGEKFEDDDTKDATAKPFAVNHLNGSGNSTGSLSSNLGAETLTDDQPNLKEKDSHSTSCEKERETLTITPKTFVATETIDGKAVNVVDGLKLYEQLLDHLEVSKLVSLIDDLRVSGRRGQLQGKSLPYVSL